MRCDGLVHRRRRHHRVQPAAAVHARSRRGSASATLRHRSSVATPTPYSRATSSSVAFSGGSNRATARSLNAFPYRATSSSHHRPQIHGFYRGDNYSDAGGALQYANRGFGVGALLGAHGGGLQGAPGRSSAACPRDAPLPSIRRAFQRRLDICAGEVVTGDPLVVQYGAGSFWRRPALCDQGTTAATPARKSNIRLQVRPSVSQPRFHVWHEHRLAAQ